MELFLLVRHRIPHSDNIFYILLISNVLCNIIMNATWQPKFILHMGIFCLAKMHINGVLNDLTRRTSGNASKLKLWRWLFLLAFISMWAARHELLTARHVWHAINKNANISFNICPIVMTPLLWIPQIKYTNIKI